MGEEKSYFQKLLHKLLDQKIIAIICVVAVVLMALVSFSDIASRPYHAWQKWRFGDQPLAVSIISLERRDETISLSDNAVDRSDEVAPRFAGRWSQDIIDQNGLFQDFSSCQVPPNLREYRSEIATPLRVGHFDFFDRKMMSNTFITPQPVLIPMRLIIRNDNAFPVIFRGLSVSVDLSYFEMSNVEELEGPSVLHSSGALDVFIGSYPNTFLDRYPESIGRDGNAWQANYHLLSDTKLENSVVAIPPGKLASFDINIRLDDFPLCHKIEFGLLVDSDTIYSDPFVIEVVTVRSSEEIDECLTERRGQLLQLPDTTMDLNQYTDIRDRSSVPRWLSDNCGI